MIAYLTLRFDKPVTKDGYFISPDGFEIISKLGNLTRFGFCDIAGYIDESDNRNVRFELEEAYFDCKNTREFINNLLEVVDLSECCVVIDKYNDDMPDIKPVEIVSFEIVESSNYKRVGIPNTDFVEIEDRPDKNFLIYDRTYRFTRKSLDYVEFI